MANTAQLKAEYKEKIAPALQKQFNYTSTMQIPVLKKIVVNQGLGDATQDKKIIDVAINEITAICGQKAVATYSKKDIANFKLRKKMPIGVMVTLRRERMYEFLEKLVRIALPRIRDFKGIESKFDGRGNYTLGIQEQIIFPEINIDSVDRIQGMNITFVTSAQTDELSVFHSRTLKTTKRYGKRINEGPRSEARQARCPLRREACGPEENHCYS